MFGPIVVGIVPMLLFRNQLNALSFGDEEARALGVNTKFIRALFTSAQRSLPLLRSQRRHGGLGRPRSRILRMIVGPIKYCFPRRFCSALCTCARHRRSCRCLFAIELL